MANIKIPEETYKRLTKFKGKLTNETGNNQSYASTIVYLLDKMDGKKVES